MKELANENSRSRNSFRNMVFAFTYQFVNLLLQFISRSIFISTLGAGYLGLSGLFSNVISVLNLADLGIESAVLYSFYKPLANKDYRKISALLKYYQKLYYGIAAVMMGGGILTVPFLQYLVKLDNEIPFVRLYYLLMVVNTAASYLFSYKICVLLADQKQYILTKARIVANACKVVIQILVLLIFKSYALYLIIGIVTTLLQNATVAGKVGKWYPLYKEEELDKQEKRSLFSNLSAMFSYKIASTVFSSTDNIILSVMFGTIQVGLYSNYSLITSCLDQTVGNVFSSMTASVGNSIAIDSPEKRLRVFEMLQEISFVMGAFFTIELTLLLNDFIRCWLGAEFLFPEIVIISVTVNFYMACVFKPMWSYREAAGVFLKLKYVMFVAAGLNIVLSIVLGNMLGVSGVFFATALSRLLTYFWYEPKILFHDYFESTTKNYYLGWGKNVVITVVLIVALQFVTAGFEVDMWAKWFLKACITSLISFLAVMLCYKNSTAFEWMKSKVYAFIRR